MRYLKHQTTTQGQSHHLLRGGGRFDVRSATFRMTFLGVSIIAYMKMAPYVQLTQVKEGDKVYLHERF